MHLIRKSFKRSAANEVERLGGVQLVLGDDALASVQNCPPTGIREQAGC